MKIKDIVNRDLVNLTNCENEPIHIPGSIQPHGFLLGLKIVDLTIDFCSGNSFEFTGLRYEQLLGKSFELVFGEAETNDLKNFISVPDHSYMAPLEIRLAGKAFNCTIQTNPEIFIVEFEPVFTEKAVIADIYQQTRQFTSYLQKASTLQALCQSVADETRTLTGYDRVMIYRFDGDYNGEVFAESKIEDVEPFLGLYYPHTDIPVQARELYIKNLLRLIVDVNYMPVPVYTTDDTANKNLDLSLSTLRSVSPIHIQYLHNMGVGATLTISLMHEQRLWGLIVCHHYSPRYINSNTRIAAQLQGFFLTSQIIARQAIHESDVARNVNKALDELLAHIFNTNSISFESIIRQPQLLRLTNAASVIITADDKIYSHGPVPPEDEIKKLINWLQTYSSPTGFSTSNLSKLYPDAKKWCDVMSGILFQSLGSGVNNCIIWCRAEALQEVHWAGNPEKAIIKDENGLSPRKSFELWKEVKKCESNQWQKPELIASTNFANAMEKHVHMLFLSKEELKYRKLSEKFKEANAELENLNWIGSHDLKEPLRKIQLFASRILDEEHEGATDSIFNSVKRMSESAKRMQTLIGDIVSYSKLSHVEDEFELIDFSKVVKSVINDLNFEINEKNAVIEYGDLPIVKGIDFLLQQLMVNLIRNALKFSRTGTAIYITINYSEEDRLPAEFRSTDTYFKIVVSDNGIGFHNKHKETIFKVFQRLHSISEYSGSGVGLALCKKIIQSHNGYITAEGTPGIGAAFSLYFPK